MDHPTTLEPTLDAHRTDQLRTFLTVEAAADAASTPALAPRRGRRRLVGGVAAAVLLGAGLFGVAAIAGGPSSGPASVHTAHAVAIGQSAPGWTKISIKDIDADPDAVVAELQAAGIDAQRKPLAFQRDEHGRMTLGSFEDTAPDGHGFSMVGLGSTGDPGDEGLAGLTVEAPDAGPSPIEGRTGSLSQADADALHAYLEDLGAKMGTDGSVEIRNDANITVLVLTAD